MASTFRLFFPSSIALMFLFYICFYFFLFLFSQNCQPSVNIKYTVVSVLYAYTYICRLHNGDHLSTPTDSAKVGKWTFKWFKNFHFILNTSYFGLLEQRQMQYLNLSNDGNFYHYSSVAHSIVIKLGVDSQEQNNSITSP